MDNNVNYIQLIKDVLSSDELKKLNSALMIKNHDERTLAVKAVFINTKTFLKVKEFYEPMYLANQLIGKGYGYQI